MEEVRRVTEGTEFPLFWSPFEATRGLSRGLNVIGYTTAPVHHDREIARTEKKEKGSLVWFEDQPLLSPSYKTTRRLPILLSPSSPRPCCHGPTPTVSTDPGLETDVFFGGPGGRGVKSSFPETVSVETSGWERYRLP